MNNWILIVTYPVDFLLKEHEQSEYLSKPKSSTLHREQLGEKKPDQHDNAPLKPCAM
jgi:hypothetical protein